MIWKWSKRWQSIIDNLKHIFQCNRNLGFNLSIDKCQLGIPEIQFLGHTISADGISSNKPKVEKFLQSVKLPKTLKQVRRLIGFMHYFQKFIPNLALKLHPFFKLLRKEKSFHNTNEHENSLEILKADLVKACNLSLKMTKPHCQFLIVCDASFYASRFILLIEEPHDSSTEKSKTYAPVVFGSHLISPAQLKHSIYAKEFLSIQLAFETFEHYVWGVSDKPIIVLTDNKSVTRFFQTKKMPGNLWNAVDYVLSFNFVLGHILGKANVAADYLSRVYVNPDTKLKLKLNDRIPVHDIEVQVLANTPDNALIILAPDFIIPTITIEPVGNSVVMQIEEFTQLKEPSIIKLSEFNPLDSYDLTKKVNAIDMKKEQRLDKDIQKVLQWLENNKRSNVDYSSYDYRNTINILVD